MVYNVKTDAFEGPLDLLLHLIKELEIDIYDIPVADITEQYLEYIHLMQRVELDVASEYLVMAATLIEMKSHMLIPKQENDIELEEAWEDDEEDPREELIRQLIDYRQYKQLAEILQERANNQSLYYYNAPGDYSRYRSEQQSDFQEGLYSKEDLIQAIQKMDRKKEIKKALHTRIERQTLPIGPRMTEIIETLKQTKKPLSFQHLFNYPDRTHVVVTFIAILELMKKQHILCEQDNNFNDITITIQNGGEQLDANELDTDY